MEKVRVYKVCSAHKFRVIGDKVVFDPISVQEGTEPIKPKIWYEEQDIPTHS